MAYMSYCRFEGTTQEMIECVDDIRNNRELSEGEAHYAQMLYGLCHDYIDMYDSHGINSESDYDDEDKDDWED